MLAAGGNVAGAWPSIFAEVLLALPFVLDILCVDAMELVYVAEHVQSWNLVTLSISKSD